MIFYDKNYKRIYDNTKVILDGKNNIIPNLNDIVECKTYYDFDNNKLVLTDKDFNNYDFDYDDNLCTLFGVEVLEDKEEFEDGGLI